MVTALRVDPLTPTTLLNLGHVRAALLHRHLRCTAYTVEHRAGTLTVTAHIGRADGSPLGVATMQRVLRDLGAAWDAMVTPAVETHGSWRRHVVAAPLPDLGFELRLVGDRA